jgi:hypothetical protein
MISCDGEKSLYLKTAKSPEPVVFNFHTTEKYLLSHDEVNHGTGYSCKLYTTGKFLASGASGNDISMVKNMVYACTRNWMTAFLKSDNTYPPLKTKQFRTINHSREIFSRNNFENETFSRKYFADNIFSLCEMFLSVKFTMPPLKNIYFDCWRFFEPTNGIFS